MFVNEFVDTIDYRSRLSPIRDQGERGTCVAFAATAGNELLRSSDLDLSEEFLYWSCKRRDGLSDEGTTMMAAIAALRELGQPLEQYCPYATHHSCLRHNYEPSNEVLVNALKFRITSGGKRTLGVSEVQTDLERGEAVVLVVRLFPGFYKTSHGVIPQPRVGEDYLGAHAVLLVGYYGGASELGGHLIFRNSWGNEWGDSGYGYLPYAYFEEVALEIWELHI